jgi:hypothetical protein
MKFMITVDIPEAVKGEVIPQEMETMFQELATHYKEQREKGIALKDSVVSIRDGSPSLGIIINSINVQGEI